MIHGLVFHGFGPDIDRYGHGVQGPDLVVRQWWQVQHIAGIQHNSFHRYSGIALKMFGIIVQRVEVIECGVRVHGKSNTGINQQKFFAPMQLYKHIV